MDHNKNQLLLLLRRDNQTLQLELEHVIVILNHNAITLQHVRKYIRYRYPVPLDHWTSLQEQTIEEAAQGAADYVRINRAAWAQKYKNYSEQVQRSKQITADVLNILGIKDQPANAELLGMLGSEHGKREQLLKIHMNTESQHSILQENRLIDELSVLLREILSYEQVHRQLHGPSDQHYQQIISKFISDNRQRYAGELQRKKENERKKVTAKMEEYERKVIVLKKRLYQIFLFYCRENKSLGLTFEDYGRTAQLIDLRLFLIYFKDYKYTDINKYRFKVTTSTQLFRNAATNGLSLSFQQFWQVHRQLFDLRDLNITRRDIIEAEVEELPEILQKWQEEIDKLKQLNNIVNEDRTKELLQFVTLKTETSPERTLIKNSSSVMMESKVASNLSSRFSRKKAYSELEGQLLSSKNFIQRVRAELNNAEDASSRVKISRYNSLSNLESQRRTATLQVNLPKILKLSTKEISSQGIYRSLKNFSEVDYRTQQKKLRDIIGLSNGEDDNLINAYLTKEQHDKQQKKRERSLDREQKRKQFLDELTKKQHHCKRYNPNEVQPYMRF